MWPTMSTAYPWVAYADVLQKQQDEWIFRQPHIHDGDDVNQLIADCPPLDINSAYCNFLQTSHFNQTCVVAECNGAIAGFISAYRKPDAPQELFVWQVAVSPRHRGKGLAFHMLQELLQRDGLQDIAALETTITKTNRGSWRLFEKLDAQHGKHGQVSTFLCEATHFNGKHDTEYLYRIPLVPSKVNP
ncbi:diaminobutyrate acetyltransferase [Vibrio sp. SM6]|uniref:L-2,4-diaminobutyric acid acetyltransferase n=1 Tax=Vibrio agarilyticus TaxID=2726741 RepID=A0A7X8TP47_9VIBR|nr:diaminobutyrate acetyltransferase [Vibrio agarilyticus]NLS12092.1 diaminobutyrate acetyltransferase [Vibrio agarilyticus]